MRAFLSDSTSDNEHYLVSTLSGSLWDNHFAVASTYGESERKFAHLRILNTNLFVGFISINGSQPDKVIHEHSIAVEGHIPTILLIEKGVYPLPLGFINHNVVYFDRQNPQTAIDFIIENTNNKENKATDAFAWLFGGEIAINLLSRMSKSKAS